LIDLTSVPLRWIDVYEDDALWDGEKVAVAAEGRKIVLLRVDGTLAAFNDACPHKGTPLSDGHLDSGVLTCGVHLWKFDAKSGKSINPVGKALLCFPVRVEAGRIFVGVTDFGEGAP
jgi:nitrite reductase/ring-hydroxylating ferredoxin subunit